MKGLSSWRRQNPASHEKPGARVLPSPYRRRDATQPSSTETESVSTSMVLGESIDPCPKKRDQIPSARTPEFTSPLPSPSHYSLSHTLGSLASIGLMTAQPALAFVESPFTPFPSTSAPRSLLHSTNISTHAPTDGFVSLDLPSGASFQLPTEYVMPLIYTHLRTHEPHTHLSCMYMDTHVCIHVRIHCKRCLLYKQVPRAPPPESSPL